MVKQAIERSEGGKPAADTRSQRASETAAGAKASKARKGYSRGQHSTVGGSIGNLHDGYAANESTDLSSAC